jgi:hypothetical protein
MNQTVIAAEAGIAGRTGADIDVEPALPEAPASAGATS